ncbi:UDP-GlcNAc:undecaprenyl-phosphate GlcNAc-1-phosphate transferase [Cryobacterium mesophilum]|uniref:Undecaprenyl/decaprenyl-phosphate alpha-N-acetylglucosaminyl 1-phosphate transferase n=1 Tax=Terrimesophilobacter mesophilus TaxID=433647 RepID=A0A4R8VBF3_9MICO|nr:MraY family glycosyltransferase [Terrimesophilobacter mesophilus]MBB5633971.1 UDP-GlcNAc:undecaprenyl-phosphate GlcNAc-1-phosphate transferase [Terrimesophilobacter mesophilus]TFB80631.1 undecaprenyl/decaprenyl-phosphate alpha-N-acetylglucosaminyl 1-phosphate transferase [Terrimesophilobacter mesophilus]
MIFYILVCVISAVVTWGLAWATWKLSTRFRLYPSIRERDVHSTPTPRLGGVAMFFGILVAFGVASQVSWFRLVFANPGQITAILAAALIIVVIGVADDIWDLDWLTKLAGQIIAAGLLVWQGVQLVTVPIGGITIVPPVLGLMLTVGAVVLVMNAVNFIDGLDGLVAGVTVIASGAFFIYSYLLARNVGETPYFNLASLITAVLIGACIGFLPLNWHPAKLFMGDSGALLVGLLMATSAISVTGQIDPDSLQSGKLLAPAFIPILLPLAILLIPLLDFMLAVTRRIRAGKSPFSADRKHLHHRLLDMGHTHLQAVLIFYSWTAVVAIGVLSFLFVPWGWSLAFIAVGLVITTVLTLAPLGKKLLNRRNPGGAPLDLASTVPPIQGAPVSERKGSAS